MTGNSIFPGMITEVTGATSGMPPVISPAASKASKGTARSPVSFTSEGETGRAGSGAVHWTGTGASSCRIVCIRIGGGQNPTTPTIRNKRQTELVHARNRAGSRVSSRKPRRNRSDGLPGRTWVDPPAPCPGISACPSVISAKIFQQKAETRKMVVSAVGKKVWKQAELRFRRGSLWHGDGNRRLFLSFRSLRSRVGIRLKLRN